MYERQYQILLRKRVEYWQTESISLKNYKLQSMVLSANACGIDLLAFVSEKQEQKQIADVKAEGTKQGSLLLQDEKQEKHLKCPYCDYETDNQKKLAGHTKKHSSKYQVFNLLSKAL